MPVSYQDFITACQNGNSEIVINYMAENPIPAGQEATSLKLQNNAFHQAFHNIQYDIVKLFIVNTYYDPYDAENQYILATYYDYGAGVDKNPEEAVKYLTLAANQGRIEAQFNLAQCYRHGRGVDKNLEKALEWAIEAEENSTENIHSLTETEIKNLTTLIATLRTELEGKEGKKLLVTPYQKKARSEMDQESSDSKEEEKEDREKPSNSLQSLGSVQNQSNLECNRSGPI